MSSLDGVAAMASRGRRVDAIDKVPYPTSMVPYHSGRRGRRRLGSFLHGCGQPYT